MAAAAPLPSTHHWYTPAECAAMLGGEPHGDRFRAACPAHQGSNPTALGIAQGRDRDGNPMTLLHCFANQCPIEDICAAMGLDVKDLFCIHPTFARTHRHGPRARSPRVDRLKAMPEPTPDEIAQIVLEEMIVSDPAWIQECTPARVKMWEIAQASPRARALFTHALHQAKLQPSRFWEVLAQDMEANA
jgi:hypothetical protein